MEFKRLNCSADAEIFLPLAARCHHRFLTEFVELPEIHAIGASDASGATGLLLCVQESSETAEIASVYVAKNYRRQHVATRLVKELELQLRISGVESVLLAVSADANSDSIQGVLKKCDWDMVPRPMRSLLIQCSADMTLASSPVVSREIYDPRLQLFPWAELRKGELADLTRDATSDTCWFPESLSPLSHCEHLFEPMCFGLRFDGQLIGWALSHRFLDGPIIVSKVFASPRPDCKMAGITLLQSIAKGLVAFSQETEIFAKFVIVEGNKFYHFIERQFVPYVSRSEISELLLFRKTLGPVGSQIECL